MINETTVPATNAHLIRDAYAAFAVGDVPSVLAVLADDITWHVPGRSPLSGDYRGHAGVLEFFGRCMERSGGTLRVAVDEILADGERVVALTTVSAERGGRAWASPEVHAWRVVGGRAVEFIEYQGDQQAEDEFWSS
jgi:ketosteroid isomerase-like protein